MTEDLVRAIAAECQSFTMLPRERLAETIAYLLDLAHSSSFPKGSVVECGTWRGGMSLAITRVFGPGRRYALYDSFAGLPPPGPRDGEDAHFWATHPEHPRHFDNCRADYGDMRRMLEIARPDHNIAIERGWYEDTLHAAKFAPIAFAHLDSDWYDSTFLCLERLWPHVTVNGVILIDDYYDWEGCRRAVHDFFSQHDAREAIERIGQHGGAVIRRRGRWTLAESPHLN